VRVGAEINQHPGPPRLWPFKRLYYGWAIVAVGLVSGFATAGMFGPVLAILVKPIGDDLGWSRATISIAFAIGTTAGSFASFAIGPFIDRHGTRLVMTVTGSFMALAMVGIAFMSEPWHFFVLVGVGRGGASAGVLFANAVNIARWFVRRRGRAQAIAGTGLRLGQVALPLMIYAVMAVSGWRASFLVLAALLLLAVVLPAWVFLRSRPEQMGLLPDGASEPLPGAVVRPDTEVQWSLKEATRTRAFWLLVIAVAGTFFINGAVNLHAVPHFEDRGMTAALAVTITTIFAVTTVVAAMAWGFITERFHVRWVTVGTALAYFVALVVIINAETYPAAVLFAILFGVASGGWTTVERLLIPNYFGRESAGAIGGAKELVVGCISPFGPITAGLVRDLTGSYIPAFTLFAVLALAVMLNMAFAKPPVKAL
jgi:MFS family permease